jgi:hypothetical protein
MGFEGMLHGLFRKLVTRQMIFFTMMDGGGSMSVCSLFVEFSGALMGLVWHDDPFYHTSWSGSTQCVSLFYRPGSKVFEHSLRWVLRHQ